MKLNKEHIGQKFKRGVWDSKSRRVFTLLAITSMGVSVGKTELGECDAHDSEINDWLPYDTQPKQEVLMSPCVINSLKEKTPEGLFSSDFLKQLINERSLGKLQTDKPLRVVLKNVKFNSFGIDSKISNEQSDIEADLWIKIDG